MKNENRSFTAYEYKDIPSDDRASFFLDCYEAFGWQTDSNFQNGKTVRIKRDRKIINKAELTRLQRHFEACTQELEQLEKSKNSAATLWSVLTGLLGAVFMALSVFSVTAQPPKILLTVLFAIPAFAGWIIPIFLYKKVLAKQTKKVQPLIEAKYDEIYETCKKGHSLL